MFGFFALKISSFYFFGDDKDTYEIKVNWRDELSGKEREKERASCRYASEHGRNLFLKNGAFYWTR